MGILSRLQALRGSAAGQTSSREPFLSTANPSRNPGCSEFEIDGWATSAFVAHTLVPLVGVHPFPLQELMLMTATVCRFEPSLIFEWGTNIGKSARIFYEISKHFHIRTAIHTCDLPDDVDHVEHPHAQRGAMVRGLAGVSLHQGDGLTTSLSLWEAAGRPKRPSSFLMATIATPVSGARSTGSWRLCLTPSCYCTTPSFSRRNPDITSGLAGQSRRPWPPGPAALTSSIQGSVFLV